MKPNKFMAEAINQAKIAFQNNEVPVGAVVVFKNEIISSAHNYNLRSNDPTAHAEISAIRKSAEFLKSPRLDGCDLYVTLEPCAMCAFAISLSRIRRVYYALSDEKFGSVENGSRIFDSSSCHHRPEVYSDIGCEEVKNLLKDFFLLRR